MNYKRIAKNIISSFNKRIFIKRRKTLDVSNIRKVLIISLYFRGDFLFHTPLIKLLSGILPYARIDVWTKSRNLELTQNNPDISKVLVFDDVKTAAYNDHVKLNIAGKFSFLRKLRNSNYDLIIDLTGHIPTALYSYFSKAGYSIGINNYGFGAAYDKFVDLQPASTKGHLIMKYLDVLRRGLDIPDIQWKQMIANYGVKPVLIPSQKDIESVNNILDDISINNEKPLVVIHTTAGWKAKEWGRDNYSRLIEMLNHKNYEFIFIGDDRDKQNFKNILENSGLKDVPKFNNHFLKLKFLEVAELINKADVFVGSDSAPLHIAGAMDTPSVGIFGPTNPDFSNPIGAMHKTVYHKLLCSATDSMQYCTRNGGMTCPTIDCMKMVTPAQVMILIQELIIEYHGKKKNKNITGCL